jgi:hypothetical protein
MTLRLRMTLVLAVVAPLLAAATLASAKRPDCEAVVLTVKEAIIAAGCVCDSATPHGQFVRCAAGAVKALAKDGTIPRSCGGFLVRGVAKSTCGRPVDFVACCRERPEGTSCTVKKAMVCDRLGGTAAEGSVCLTACLPASPSGAFVD